MRVSRALGAAGFAAGLALILLAARGDLWFDEIWSLSLAENARSAWDVVAVHRHDNNHVLNTLLLRLIGPQRFLPAYRLPAVLCGVASLLLTARLAGRRGEEERAAALVVAGTSYPLVLYFSEARGYAPAMLCALATHALLGAERRPRAALPALWAVAWLGVLSHATFAMAYLPLLLWDLLRERRSGRPARAQLGRLALRHAPPLAFLAAFYLFYVRRMAIGGGPMLTTWDAVSEIVALALGFPDGPLGRVLAVAVCAALVCAGAVLLRRDGDDRWPLFPAALLLSPSLFLAVSRPTYLYPRYFVVLVPFLCLLLAALAGRLLRSPRPALRWCAVGALALFVAGQALRVVPLLRFGRGSYRSALVFMAEHTPGRTLRVGSDSDYDIRTRTLLGFYARFLPPGVTVRHLSPSEWRREPPDWLLTQSRTPPSGPPVTLSSAGVGLFRLERTYPSSGPSGWAWHLYRRTAAPQGPGGASASSFDTEKLSKSAPGLAAQTPTSPETCSGSVPVSLRTPFR